VSSGPEDHPPARAAPPPELAHSLGYLLKHAQLRLSELNAAALAPYGLLGRELAVLLVLAGCEPASQQQAAHRLGVDRTTMVALLDTLEAKGLVARHPDPHDRRKNVLTLTAAGRDTLRRATRASEEAQRRFLAPLTPAAARQLRDALHTLVTGPDAPAPAGQPARRE
jgi:DNA-binding MarR family transcriptional regulator